MFKSIPLSVVFILSLGCNNESKTGKKEKDSTSINTNVVTTTNGTDPKTSTNDAYDEHGCAAEGKIYSVIKRSCVTLAAQSVRLDPKDPALDANKPSYLLFDSVKVEIFLPTQTKSVIIRKSSAEPPVWANGPLKLTLSDGMYSLYDEGKLLYQGRE